jgi:nucleoredoxin
MSKQKQESTPSPMEEMLGKSLLTWVGKEMTTKPTDKALQHEGLVALYFSAHWCPPCQSFTPLLKEFYNNTKGQIEIVYISSDRTMEEFNDYYGKMPWLALPTDGDAAQIKNKLAEKFKIRGIPALIILNKKGHIVTDQAKKQVMKCYSRGSMDLIDSWKATKAVPVEEADLGKIDYYGGLWNLFVGIAKNPVSVV